MFTDLVSFFVDMFTTPSNLWEKGDLSLNSKLDNSKIFRSSVLDDSNLFRSSEVQE